MTRIVTGNYVLNNSRVWNPYGSSTTDAPVSRIEQADNSSPLGRGIPKGIGTTGRKGEIIVDPDQFGGVRIVNDKYIVTLVLGFQDTDLGGASTLLWLKANEEFIYRNASPQRAPSSPIRIYRGDQDAVDPAILTALGASEATYWPGLAYIVLEDFDITPYSDNGEIPVFTGAWSTDVTAAASATETSTITFGSLASYINAASAYDATLGVAYQWSYDDDNQVYISTIDVANNTEIRRVSLSSSNDYGYAFYMVALAGSPYVVVQCFTQFDSGDIAGLRMIDTRTGSIVSTLHAIYNGDGANDGYWEPGIHSAHLLKSDVATKYAVLCFNYASTGIVGSSILANDGIVVLADVTAGTLSYIAHPDTNPLRGASTQTVLNSWSVRDVSNGVLTAYFTEDNGTTVYSVNISEAGPTNTTAIYTTPSSLLSGVAYDAIDNALVIALENQTLRKILLSSLSTEWTQDVSGTGDPFLNSIYYTGTNYTNPGFGVVTFGDDDAYLCDFSDGGIGYLAENYEGFLVYDQYNGIAVEADHSGAPNEAPAIYKHTFGDTTPNTVDAADILTSLMTYQGDYSSGDLTFTSFPGNECSGLDVSSDTTIDALKQDVCSTLGIRETHDAAKVKFTIPPRDGSYALDATLTDYHITINGVQQSIADEDAAFERVTIDYIDPGADYTRNTQEYVRPNGSYTVVNSNKRGNVQTNLVMSATQAAKAAQRITYESDLNRRAYTFEVMPSQIAREPSDIVSFAYGPANDYTVVGEIRASEIRRDFTQALELTEYLRGIETTFTGTSLVQVVPTAVNTSGQPVLLDTALLSLGDDLGGSALRSYVVFLGAGEADLSASSFYKSADGFEYTLTGQISDVAPVAGVISDISRNYSDAKQTDYEGTLGVQIGSGDIDDLATVTEAQKYALENYAAIGDVGRWVLIAYRTVSASGQVATLGEIIWGLRGTEVYLSSLTAGDRFINLETNELIRFSEITSLRTSTAYYKGGYAGWQITSFPTIAHTVDGEAEKPYAVENLAASVVAGGIQFSCNVRERLGIVPVLNGVQSAGYSEGGVSMEWDVYDNSSPQVLLRTLTSSAENVTYTNAQIETDFGAIPDSITVKAYQMSRLDFRGHEATATLTISNPATFDTTAITFDSGVTTWDAAA